MDEVGTTPSSDEDQKNVDVGDHNNDGVSSANGGGTGTDTTIATATTTKPNDTYSFSHISDTLIFLISPLPLVSDLDAMLASMENKTEGEDHAMLASSVDDFFGSIEVGVGAPPAVLSSHTTEGEENDEDGDKEEEEEEEVEVADGDDDDLYGGLGGGDGGDDMYGDIGVDNEEEEEEEETEKGEKEKGETDVVTTKMDTTTQEKGSDVVVEMGMPAVTIIEEILPESEQLLRYSKPSDILDNNGQLPKLPSSSFPDLTLAMQDMSFTRLHVCSRNTNGQAYSSLVLQHIPALEKILHTS